MRRALWEVPRTHGYLSKQAGSCCTKLRLKTGLFDVAKNRKSQHFDKVVLKEYKQGSQAPCLHKFPKNRAVGRNKKHNLQAPAEDQSDHFPPSPFPCASEIVQASSINISVRNYLVCNFLCWPLTSAFS